jgi:long-chain acyl-CoA synthetase
MAGRLYDAPCKMFGVRPPNVHALTLEGRRWADRAFIIHGRRRVTYSEHEAAVDRFTETLGRLGIGRGDRLALFARNSAEWSVAFFGALRVGAIAVPCNGWWSADEMAHACRTVSPAVVVCDERGKERVPAAVPTLPIEEVSSCIDTQRPAVAHAAADIDENDPAVVLFTSGTTGFPRGVTLTHRALIANVQNLLVVSGRPSTKRHAGEPAPVPHRRDTATAGAVRIWQSHRVP